MLTTSPCGTHDADVNGAGGYGVTVIRTAVASDVETLVALERTTSIAALRHIFAGVPYPHDDVRARWALVLADASATVLLDEDGGSPVGFAAYGDGWLRHFGVMPHLWGTGRADRLHDAVLERSTAEGTPTSRLWVLTGNGRARAFYVRRGWCETGVREAEAFAPYPEKMQMIRPTGGGATAWISG